MHVSRPCGLWPFFPCASNYSEVALDSLGVEFWGTDFFQCNYDYNLDLNGHLPEFYKQIIHHWQKKSFLRHLTARPRYCLRQYGTTNSLRLTTNGKSASLAPGRKKHISQLFDEHKNCFLPFLPFVNLQLFTTSWSYIRVPPRGGGSSFTALILATLLHPRRQSVL